MYPQDALVSGAIVGSNAAGADAGGRDVPPVRLASARCVLVHVYVYVSVSVSLCVCLCVIVRYCVLLVCYCVLLVCFLCACSWLLLLRCIIPISKIVFYRPFLQGAIS